MIEQIIVLDNADAAVFYGVNNSNLQLLKTLFPKLRIIARGNIIKVIGNAEEIPFFEEKIRELELFCIDHNVLTEDNIIDIVKGNSPNTLKQDNLIIYGMNGKPIVARNDNQQKLVESFRKNDMVFALGPAGTGKTYLAVAQAVADFRQKKISRIILTRPAIEAGESLGFLPGDLQHKVDPYLRPLYDALFDMLGGDGFSKYLERGQIEVAPLAYMRGRTLDDSFIILALICSVAFSDGNGIAPAVLDSTVLLASTNFIELFGIMF